MGEFPGLSVADRKRVKTLVASHSCLRCESYGFGVDRKVLVFRDIGAARRERAVEQRKVEDDALEITFGSSDGLGQHLPQFGVSEDSLCVDVHLETARLDALERIGPPVAGHSSSSTT